MTCPTNDEQRKAYTVHVLVQMPKAAADRVGESLESAKFLASPKWILESFIATPSEPSGEPLFLNGRHLYDLWSWKEFGHTGAMVGMVGIFPELVRSTD